MTAIAPTEQAFRPIKDFNFGARWTGSLGFYIHRNRLYLQGHLFNGPAPAARLFSGLRPELCPAADVVVTIPLIIPDPATPGIVVPDSITATMSPDGGMTLNASLPYADAPPADPLLTNLQVNLSDTVRQPDFPSFFIYTLVMGNVSWPLGAELADDPTWESLGPFLGSTWENIDAEIAVSDARVLLRGRVRAAESGAGSLQPIARALPGAYLEHLSDVGGLIATNVEASFDGAYLVVELNGSLVLPDDTRYETLMDQGSEPQVDPPWSLKFPVDEAGQRSPPGFGNWFPLVEANWFYLSGLSQVQGGWDGSRSDSTVGGLSSQPGQFNPPYGPFDPGGARIARTWVEGSSAADEAAPPDVWRVISTAISISDAIASFYPAPDWVGLAVAAFSADHGISAVYLELTGGEFELRDFNNNFMPSSTEFFTPTFMLPGPEWHSGPYNLCGYVGHVDGDGKARYPHDPHNKFLNLLWKPDELPQDWEITAHWQWTRTFFVSQGALEVSIHLGLIPFWKTRRNWILAGDVVTLDGAGWQHPFQPPIPTTPPGNIQQGPAAAGLLPVRPLKQ